jgi:SAM-dependent methyltransferase
MRIQTEADFDALVRSAKLLAVASAWSELGLWDRLARHSGPVDLAELPGNTRALSITAAVLAHAGLLEGGGDRWMMSRTARDLHARRALPVGRNFGWLEDLHHMPDVLRDGGPVLGPDGKSRVTSGGVRPDDTGATRDFLDMLYRRSHESAETAAGWIAGRLPPDARVLDLGGGHGRYAEAFTARGMKVTLFDFPLVVDLARERHGDRIAYRAGDFHKDQFGGPYDGVFLSNVLHGEPPEANAALIARVHRALAPGGWAILKDMFIDEQGRNPENAVFFGVTMLFYTQGGRSYGFSDVNAWCEAAGFGRPDAVSIDTFSLIFAQKPAS